VPASVRTDQFYAAGAVGGFRNPVVFAVYPTKTKITGGGIMSIGKILLHSTDSSFKSDNREVAP
jgi:hypothetical protein